MSGIAGIIRDDGAPVPRADVEGMLAVLAHRGPDASNTWVENNVGLGHRLLRNTPESIHEHQPLPSENGKLHLVADARVDNRDELRVELKRQGHSLQSETDAEFILRAYEAWGEDCPAKILGDFAFAIWDNDRRQLFCARDPVGVKPFFYAFDGRTFRFASEPKAIFAGGSVARTPNLGILCLFLLGQHNDPEETLDQEVRRLPAGHGMVVRGGRLHKKRYWDIDPDRTITHRTDDEYAEHFRAVFSDSVRVRLRGHGPIGVLLSGGLDSSSIACVARQQHEGLETFSMVYDGMPCDERTYIEDVVGASNMRAHYVPHDGASDSLDPDQARDDPDLCFFPTLFVLAPALHEARRAGVRSMLDGMGGDDLLAASFFHLADLVRGGRVRQLWRQLRDDAAYSGFSRTELLLRYGLRPLIPGAVRKSLRRLLRAARPELPAWINPACARQSGALDRLRAGMPQTRRFPSYSQQKMYDELMCGWNTNVALAADECFTSRFSIESRHPFFDRRVIEFLLAVPEEQRWTGPWPKTILRRAMRGILPESVRQRQSKAEFSCVVGQAWSGSRAERVRAIFQAPVLSELGILLANRFRPNLEDYLRGNASPHQRAACEKVIELEFWCRSAQASSRR